MNILSPNSKAIENIKTNQTSTKPKLPKINKHIL